MSNNNLHEITSCEVCENDKLETVLDLGSHPMCDDLVSVEDNRICQEYPIEVMFCKKCFTAHQRFQIPKRDLFPITYHYRSRFTADVLNGMDELVGSTELQFGILAGKTVLDIGCNDGSLLDLFREKGALTIGLEPTGASRDAEKKGHVIFDDYLSKDLANKILKNHNSPDFITFTNVFAHIENLYEVLEALKLIISKETVIIIENHYMGAVLLGNQFDTFYHEHPRTYSYTSFVNIAKTLGLDILDIGFPSRYGGNIRVFMGNSYKAEIPFDNDNLSEKEGQFFELFSKLAINIEKWQRSKKKEISDLVEKYGKIRAKAFPGRAAILVKLLDINENQISAVYEKPGSMKIGHYIPGTRIPIHSDNELFNLKNDSTPILNLAWHIPVEIKSYLAKCGFSAPIIDILNQKDLL